MFYLEFNFLCCSTPEPKCRKVVESTPAGDDVPAGSSAEAAGADLSTTSTKVVTVAVAGTVPGLPEPSAGATQPPATSSVVKPQGLRLKPIVKKSTL